MRAVNLDTLLKLLSTVPGATMHQLSEMTKESTFRLNRYLQWLRKKGYVTCVQNILSKEYIFAITLEGLMYLANNNLLDPIPIPKDLEDFYERQRIRKEKEYQEQLYREHEQLCEKRKKERRMRKQCQNRK